MPRQCSPVHSLPSEFYLAKDTDQNPLNRLRTPRWCVPSNLDLEEHAPSFCPSRCSSRTSPSSSRRWSSEARGRMWDNDARSSHARISLASYPGRRYRGDRRTCRPRHLSSSGACSLGTRLP